MNDRFVGVYPPIIKITLIILNSDKGISRNISNSIGCYRIKSCAYDSPQIKGLPYQD